MSKKFASINDFVNELNKDLQNEATDFQNFRKQTQKAKRVGGSKFFETIANVGYAYNKGGATECQFNINVCELPNIRAGLAFSAQYVPFATNQKSPVEFIRPYIKAFFSTDVQELCKELMDKTGADWVCGKEDIENIKNGLIKDGGFWEFGKIFLSLNEQVTEISDDDYFQLIQFFKDLIPIYKTTMKKAQEYIELEDKILKENEKDSRMRKELSNLLIANKQIILTGAPGTGKTYLAMNIAEKMTEGDKQRIGFVQFHPNYDYSDFVEGIKPKILAKNAFDFTESSSKPESKNNSDINQQPQKLSECLQSGQIEFELVTGIFKKFCERAKSAYDKATEEDSDKENKNAPKFVFVIDEINRADLSRVFGELFFGLEADYRGKPIKMQYSYLYGDKPFSIPPNVYIIGTMNDIDRSVESIDFALRRRFAWKEISAKESEHIIDKADISNDLKQKAKERMSKLNAKIEEIMGSSSYQIGGAYFKKLENYKEDQNPFEGLWNNHLRILLNEYLRGEADAEKKLADLKASYDLK